MNKLKQFWAGLPRPVQTVLVVAEGGAVAAALQLVSDPGAQLCWSRACLKHFAGAIVAGAFIAVRQWVRTSPKEIAQLAGK